MALRLELALLLIQAVLRSNICPLHLHRRVYSPDGLSDNLQRCEEYDKYLFDIFSMLHGMFVALVTYGERKEVLV